MTEEQIQRAWDGVFQDKGGAKWARMKESVENRVEYVKTGKVKHLRSVYKLGLPLNVGPRYVDATEDAAAQI
jgi:hypothetical protein